MFIKSSDVTSNLPSYSVAETSTEFNLVGLVSWRLCSVLVQLCSLETQKFKVLIKWHSLVKNNPHNVKDFHSDFSMGDLYKVDLINYQ